MIKVSSLDFSNKKNFEMDVMSEDGTVIFKAGDKVTPEILLRLYFKDIFIEKFPDLPVLPEVEEETQDLAVEEIEKEFEQLVAAPIPEPELSIVEEEIEEVVVESEPQVEEEPLEDYLEFDEANAEKIAEYSVKLGKQVNLSPSKIEQLKQSAYYYKIGITQFKKEDLQKEDFIKTLAEVSYEILLKERNFPINVAEVAKLYYSKYDINSTKFDEDVPYYHIVGVVDYYQESLKKGINKEQILSTMLRLGGNKFNIFVLHKFIKMVRDLDE